MSTAQPAAPSPSETDMSRHDYPRVKRIAASAVALASVLVVNVLLFSSLIGSQFR